MEFNFEQDEINQILKGLKSIGDEELYNKIQGQVNLKQENNHKMLEDFYGNKREFEIVDVNSADTEKLEELMMDYDDTNQTFYDDGVPYTILKSKNPAFGLEFAVNQDEWEEWLNSYES